MRHRHAGRGHHGGEEADCPALVDTLPAHRRPALGRAGQLRARQGRVLPRDHGREALAYSNYFVARTGSTATTGSASWTSAKTAAVAGQGSGTSGPAGVPRLRPGTWPHGDWGPAKPHSMLSSPPTTTSVDARRLSPRAGRRPGRAGTPPLPAAAVAALLVAAAGSPRAGQPGTRDSDAPPGTGRPCRRNRCSGAPAHAGRPEHQRMGTTTRDHRHGRPRPTRTQLVRVDSSPGAGSAHTATAPGPGGVERGHWSRPSPPRDGRPVRRRGGPLPPGTGTVLAPAAPGPPVPFAVDTGERGEASHRQPRARRPGVPGRGDRRGGGQRRHGERGPGRQAVRRGRRRTTRRRRDARRTSGSASWPGPDDTARGGAEADVVGGRRPGRPPDHGRAGAGGRTPCSSSPAGRRRRGLRG